MDLQQKMVVISHKTVVMQCNAKTFSVKAKKFFKVLIVLCFCKDNSLFYTSVEYVVVSVKFYAWFAGNVVSFYGRE